VVVAVVAVVEVEGEVEVEEVLVASHNSP